MIENIIIYFMIATYLLLLFSLIIKDKWVAIIATFCISIIGIYFATNNITDISKFFRISLSIIHIGLSFYLSLLLAQEINTEMMG